MSIVIVYHSGYGHTQIVAEHILKGVLSETPQTVLLTTTEAESNIDLLHQADTLVFGSPTYMGSVSAEFKKFMEFTGKFWYKHNLGKINSLLGLPTPLP
jgi:multimeric flavodoxin WrbA